MIKNTTTNDDNFPPLGATVVVDLDSQTRQGGIKEPSTWKLIGRKSKSPSNSRTVVNSDGKSYKNTLCIDTTVTRTKHLKTLSIRSEGTAAITNTTQAVKIKQETIEDRSIKKYFAPIFHITEGFMCTNDKIRKPAADTIPKKNQTYTEEQIVEKLMGTGRRTRTKGTFFDAKR